MSPRELKVVFAILALILSALGIDWLAAPRAEALLREARSEVVVPPDSPTTRPIVVAAVAPETRRAPGLLDAGVPVHRAETQPVGAAVGTGAPARPPTRVPKTVAALVRSLLGYPLVDDPTRAINDATKATGQASPAIESHAYGVVGNDPANPMTGEMTHTHPIVRVPGVGLDFSFVLTYRSGFTYDGPVGNRWDHNWNARFFYNSGANTITRHAQNRVDVYNSAGSGAYTPPTGFFEKSVTRTAASGGNPAYISRRLQDGTLETYTELSTSSPYTNWYFLTKVEHRDADNAITLAYDGGQKLTKISDTRGKDFALTYDSNQRVSYVQDFSGGGGTADRVWKLSYTSGNLTSIETPAVGGTGTERKTEFTYTSTDSYLQDVKAPREVVSGGEAYLSMTYDTSTPKKVATQRFGTSSPSQTFTLSYDTTNNRTTETDREGVKRIYHFHGTTKAITKIQQEVSSGVFEDTLMSWDSDDLLTKITYPEGNGQLFQYTHGHVTASIKSTSSGLGATSISSMRSGSDHLVTEYEYQTATNWELVTKVTDPRANEWKIQRDSLGNVTTYVTPEYPSSYFTLAYDSRSRLTRVDDPEGRARSFGYGASGTLTKITVDPDTGGLQLATTLGRDKFENVVSITDPESLLTTIDRNPLNFVTKITTPEGIQTDYLYDRNDLVTEVHRDYGSAFYANAESKTVYVYSILDIVVTKTESFGASYASSRSWVFGYDKEDRLTLVTLPKSNRVKTVYDYKGQRLTLRSAEGTADEKNETFAYDKNNRLTLSKDGDANATTRVYDQFDRLTKTTDPEGHYRTVDFDKNSNATATRGYNASNTKLTELLLEYDKNNRLTKRSHWAKKADLSTSIGSGTIETTLAYDKTGLLTQRADPCGCGSSTNTSYAFDKASRMTKVTDAASNTVTYTLDKNGLTTKITRDEVEASATKTYVTNYKYNSDRHLTEVSEVGGGSATAHTVAYAVDADGRIMTATDANSQVMTMLRDDFGKVTKVRRKMTTAPTYIDTTTQFDDNDNVVTRTSVRASGDSYSVYIYDNADRVITMKDEGGTISRVIYDDADNVVTSYDRNGSRSDFLYDKRNLVTQIDFTLATGVAGPTQEKFWYDGAGRTTKAYNQDGLVTRTWNSLSKLELETTWVMPTNDSGAGTTSRNIEYVFDASGRATEVKYPDTSSDSTRLWVRYTFDSLNRITKIEKKSGSGGTYASAATWVFQGPSRMKTLELGNSTKETMTYDAYGRGTKLVWDRPFSSGRTSIFEYTRGYDLGNRPTFERRDYWKGYNSAAQLGSYQDYGDRYYYDAADRLTKVIRGVGSATASHSAAESETASDYFVTTRYDFDEGGNRQTLHYDVPAAADVRREDHTFDIENELTRRKVYDWNGSTLTLTSDTTNTFDANGNQMSNPTVKVDMHNRIYEYGTWRYRYDPFGRRTEKHDTSANGWWVRMYFDGVRSVDEHSTTKTGSADPVEGTQPFYVRIFGPYLVDQLLWGRWGQCPDCTVEAYCHSDFLGTVVAFTSVPGTGDPKILEQYRYDEYGQPYFFDGDGNSISASAGYQTYLFTGREWDEELTEYYFRARHYRQQAGIFCARDPLGPYWHGSDYDYSNRMPCSLVDPLGTQAASARAHGCPPIPREELAVACDRKSTATKICVPDMSCAEKWRSHCNTRADGLQTIHDANVQAARDELTSANNDLSEAQQLARSASGIAKRADEAFRQALRVTDDERGPGPWWRVFIDSLGGRGQGSGGAHREANQMTHALDDLFSTAAESRRTRSFSERADARERAAQEGRDLAFDNLMNTIGTEGAKLDDALDSLRAGYRDAVHNNCCTCEDWAIPPGDPNRYSKSFGPDNRDLVVRYGNKKPK